MNSSKNADEDMITVPVADTAIIFDTDGTLLDGRDAVVEAVQQGLVETYRHFHLEVPEIGGRRIARCIGLPSSRYFSEAFDPDSVPREMHYSFAGEFELRSTRAEVAALEKGRAPLYPGTEETLETLARRGHPMFLFSNAASPYFRAVIRAHKLDRFFQRTLSLEYAVSSRVARSKKGIIKYLAGGYRNIVVVGDRIHDIDAGHSAGARTVGCLFGFGDPEELESADWKIGELLEILDLPLTGLPAASG